MWLISSKSDQQLIFYNNSTLSYKQIAKTTSNKTAIRRKNLCFYLGNAGLTCIAVEYLFSWYLSSAV